MTFGRKCLVVAVAAAIVIWWPAHVQAQDGRPTVGLRVTASHVSLEEFEELVPALREFNLPKSLKIDELTVEGPRNDLKVGLAIESESGAIRGSLEVTTDAATRIRGKLRLDKASVARVLEQPTLPSEYTGNVEFDIRSARSQGGTRRLTGSYRLDTQRVVAAGFAVEGVRASGRIDGDRITVDASGRAYGARVTAKGNVQLPEQRRRITYTLAGKAEGLDLRRLPARIPVPDLESRLDFAYTVNGRGTTVDGRLELDPSTVSGAKVADGTAVRFAWNGELLEYDASGSLAGLDLTRLGREADVAILREPRFAGQVTGRFAIAGRGRELSKATLDLTDAKIFSGSLSGFHADLTWGEGTFGYVIDGGFRELALEQLIDDNRTSGQLTGRVKVKGELPRMGYALQWRGGSIDGDAQLERSILDGLTVETLAIAGRASDGVMTLDRFDASGDVRAHASGRLVFENDGESSFAYHVETPSLSPLRRRWPRLPEGAVVLDGKVTGPASAPHFAGMLSASSLSLGSVTALTSKTSYEATIPDFDLARVRVDAQTDASIVSVGRLTMPTIEGKWSYGGDGFMFDVRTADRSRTIEVAGALRLEAGQQEWRLQRLAVGTSKGKWALATAGDAVVNVSEGQLVVVSPFTLMGTDESITISGRLGAGLDDALVARLQNVDLAFLGLWIDRQDLSGRVNATVDVTGSLEAPRFGASFEVLAGAMRQYRFESLIGTATYEPGGVRLDARLNQDKGVTVSIAGHVPIAGPSGSGENGGAGGLDLTIKSDTISLAAVQSVTSYLSNVAGTARLDVRVTGSPSEPTIVGDVEIKGGAFDLTATGVRYTGLDTTIRFEPRAIVLSDFILRDDDDNTIHVTGSLPALGLRDGTAAIDVLVDGATVLDNNLGHLEIAGVMRITADPKWVVTASLDIQDGTLRVDRWLERRPRAVRANVSSALTVSDEADESQGLFADLPVALDLRLNTDGLLLRGRNLRRNSPLSLGLGDVNIITEGQLHLTKAGGAGAQIVGDLELVRGTYSFQGREFEIDRGSTVQFIGGDELNPIINITGRREITGVQAQVRVTGTLREPRLSLTSQPPLDEAEILSLVVFNEQVNSLGSNQQFALAQRGVALAGGALTQAFSDTLSDALDIDLFDFQVATTSDQDIGGVLTVGERIGDRVFVKARQLFGPNSPTQVSVEYDIAKHWRLQTSFAEDRTESRTYRRPVEKGSIDLKFGIRY